MTFKQAVSSGWQNKFVFSGRSTRSAFWFWYLFYAIVIRPGCSPELLR